MSISGVGSSVDRKNKSTCKSTEAEPTVPVSSVSSEATTEPSNAVSSVSRRLSIEPTTTTTIEMSSVSRRLSIDVTSPEPILTVLPVKSTTVPKNVITDGDIISLPQVTPTKTMAETVSSSQKKSNLQARRTQASPSENPLFPGKDQAVILQSVEGVTIAQYLREMANQVGGKNILFASRMSLGRIGFYFTSVTTVNSFMVEHGGISIKDQFLPARRMVTASERLVLSNVCPSIPHEVIAAALSSVLRIVSPMTFISLGSKEGDLGHVFSFRRQVFVVRPEGRNLPDSILIEFDGEKYRIFISFEDLRCFKCRQSGHIARNCSKTPQTVTNPCNDELTTTSLVEKNTISSKEVVSEMHEVQVPLRNPKTVEVVFASTSEINQLDCLLEEVMTQSEKAQQENHKEIDLITETKKPHGLTEQKCETVQKKLDESYQELPDEVVELFVNLNGVISADLFIQFLQDVKGNDRPLQVAQRYTNDIPALIAMLSKTLPFLRPHRAIRERVRRLIATMQKSNNYLEATGDVSLNQTSSENT